MKSAYYKFLLNRTVFGPSKFEIAGLYCSSLKVDCKTSFPAQALQLPYNNIPETINFKMK